MECFVSWAPPHSSAADLRIGMVLVAVAQMTSSGAILENLGVATDLIRRAAAAGGKVC